MFSSLVGPRPTQNFKVDVSRFSLFHFWFSSKFKPLYWRHWPLPIPALHWFRTLWAKVLSEVKKFSERRMADIDMTKLWAAFDSAFGIIEINEQAVKQIQELVELLKAFGSIEDRFSQSQEEEKSRFTEKMVSLAAWSKTLFKPDLVKMNDLLIQWSANSPVHPKDNGGDSLAHLSEQFTPIESVDLPAEFDDAFLLQCAMAMSKQM